VLVRRPAAPGCHRAGDEHGQGRTTLARTRDSAAPSGRPRALCAATGRHRLGRRTAELEKQLAEARKTSQILGKATVGGAEALKIGTPLGGVIVWEKDGTTLVAAGMVPMSDLEAFASSVR
jgi:hypothetical protein